MQRRIRATLSVLAGALLIGTSSLVAASTANASVPTTYCNGKSYQSVVKTYHRGAGAYPLRCGTASFGFVHIIHRWNAKFDSEIALTIAHGEDVSDVQQDGGSNIFALFDNNITCNELFRVIYNGGAYRGNGVRPQGIITAYYTTSSAATPAERKKAMRELDSLLSHPAITPDYGTTCPVVQGI